jgi:hypothetical protein
MKKETKKTDYDTNNEQPPIPVIEANIISVDGVTPKKKRGNPAHVKTETNSLFVEKMAGLGIPIKMIANQIGIDDNTVERHYKAELLNGQTIATTQVAQRLFDIAMSSDKNALSACIFWMKCRARWSEAGKNQDISINMQSNNLEVKVDNKQIEAFKQRWNATSEAEIIESDQTEY